jgi:pimeloyl-ACP methyl ester carboxylesterase
MRFVLVILLGIALRFALAEEPARQPAFEQDPRLDNLHHTDQVETAPLTNLTVTRYGRGRVPVILIPDAGIDPTVFAPLGMRLGEKFSFYALTLPGTDETAALPMPPDGTSYGAMTWHHAVVEALARWIRDQKLSRPIVVGHLLSSTQMALLLGAKHGDLLGGVVLAGGYPQQPIPDKDDRTKRSYDVAADKRKSIVDQFMAPLWFKTVTRTTWNANNYSAQHYAADPSWGKRLWDQNAATPISVLVRFLCESITFNPSDWYGQIKSPTLIVIPGFTADLLANDPWQLPQMVQDSWQSAHTANARFELHTLAGARFSPWIDTPEAFDRLLTAFAAKHRP